MRKKLKFTSPAELSWQNWWWQPAECDLEPFDASVFASFTLKRPITFVGDSVVRQMYDSMLCLLASRNHSISFISDPFLVDNRRHLGICTPHHRKIPRTCSLSQRKPGLSADVDLERADQFVRALLRTGRCQRKHIVVLSTGIWLSMHGNVIKNSTHIFNYTGFSEGIPGKILPDLLRQTLRTVGTQLVAKQCNATFIYRTQSPQHFQGGAWNSGGHCEQELNVTNIEQELVNDTKYPHLPSLEAEREAATILGSRLHWRLLDITSLTLARRDAHPGALRRAFATDLSKGTAQDCLHWCLPGVPDVWNALLALVLLTKEHFDDGLARTLRKLGGPNHPSGGVRAARP